MGFKGKLWVKSGRNGSLIYQLHKYMNMVHIYVYFFHFIVKEEECNIII